MARTQLGLRLPEEEAEELRSAATAARMTLGELVMTLLRQSRAEDGRGLWVDLDPVTTRGLAAVAAASESDPESVLRGLVQTWLAGDLGQLQRELQGAAVGALPSLVARGLVRGEPPAPLADDEDEPDDVLFTVSED